MRAAILVLTLLLLAPFAIPSAAAHEREVFWDPAAEAGAWPTYDEVQSHLDQALEDPRVSAHEVGETESGLPIRVLEFKSLDSEVPDPERVTTLLLTQQHGNEPAGTPAALQIIDRLLGGDLEGTLENQVVLMLPMANPDGAEANARRNQQDVDINRDHVVLETAEGRAIHKVLTTWDVHVALDHHEYSGTGPGYPFPVRTYDWDLTSLYPRHGNVQPASLEAAKNLMYDGIWAHAQEEGYSTGLYGEQTIAGVPIEQVAGGPDPGILRNNFGLYNVAGLLIETFVGAEENPFHDAERRTDIHVTVMEATLHYVHQHTDTFLSAKATAERENMDDPPTHYVEGETRSELAQAYQATVNLDALMALHGLPPAAVSEHEGSTYDLRHDRIGLAAAILHPDSSRSVADAEPVDVEALPVQSTDPDLSEQESPPAPLGLMLAGLAALLLLRRRR